MSSNWSAVFKSAMCVAACYAGLANAQDFPNKPIRIITSSTGSSTDVVARMIAQGLSVRVGQPAIIDNRGGGFIQAELVLKAPADGYTMVIAAGGLWIAPLLQKAPYDPVKDFAPISLVTITPNVLFVHPSIAVTSVKELIALAKAKPGQLNYASGGTGGTSHLAGELFNVIAGTRVVRVPYKSGSQQLFDLLNGQVQMQFNTLDGYQDYIKTGRLRAIAVGSTKPTPLLPGVPTLATTLPGFESTVSLGMFAPAKTPAPVIARVNREVVGFLNSDEARARLLAIAVEPVGSSPEGLASAVAAEIKRFGKLISDLGITAQ